MFHDLALMLSTFALVVSCSLKSKAPPADVRAALLASAEKSDPDHPDGSKLLLTHFSHLGRLTTSKGKTIFVADRRAVIAGMLAPRGRNAILFFDGRFRFLGKVGYVASRPLWCENGKLYLFGDLDGFATGLSGNVIDLTDGYKNLKAYHAHAYGSSGGIEE